MAIASVLPVLFFAGAPPPMMPMSRPSISQCRRSPILAASDADNLEAFSRWRRQWSSPMLDADHPAIASLSPATFTTQAPELTTKLEIEDCGLHRLLLVWNSQQLGQGDELVPVGSMEFHLNTPCKQISGLEEVLATKCAELKNIDILQPFRGQRGTRMLMEEMVRVVDMADSRYIVLRHLDRGSGKLVRYYENFGFLDARTTLPADDDVQKHLDQDHMIAEVAVLRGKTAEMGSQPVATLEAETAQPSPHRHVKIKPTKKRIVVRRQAPAPAQTQPQATLHPLPY